jgi:hypothetical protein
MVSSSVRTDTVRAVPWPSLRWCAYFRANARSLMQPRNYCGSPRSRNERLCLERSFL